MKKVVNKQAKKASKLAKAQNMKNKFINVKNAEGDPDTQAEIVIQNKIDYTPKVSVIIPVYNVEEYLRQCLDSVTNQTLKEIEIICVDDGSTDSSLEILKEYAKKDNRITVMKQENLHAGVARNAGLAVAKGEYIHFLDSDDWVETNMLEKTFKRITKDNADICVFIADCYNNNTKEYKPMPWGFVEKYIPSHEPFSSDDIKEHIFNFCQSWPWNKLIKHSFINQNKLYFQSLTRTNDLLFIFMALSLANKIVTVRDCLLHYRIGLATNLQSNNTKTPLDWYYACMALKKQLIKLGLYEKFEQSLVNCVMGGSQYNYNSIANNDIKEKLRQIIKNEVSHTMDIYKHIQDTRYFHNEELLKSFYRDIIRDKKRPYVSVLIPIYNTSHYLHECINSVINQTLHNIEIILINDGSTDNSLDIIKEYAAKDKRIRYINKPNAGYGQTINCGLNSACGEYISIVESDDYILPKMYETLYYKAKEQNLDIIKSDFKLFEGDNEQREFTPRPLFRDLSQYNQVSNCSKNINLFRVNNINCNGIFRTDFINKHKIRLNQTPGASFQDNGFWFQTFCWAERISFIQDSFYMIRRDNPNSSVKSKAKVFCICEEYEFIGNFLKNNPSLYNKFYNMYLFHKFHNYLWTLNRVAEEFKLMFLKRFSEDFKTDIKKIDNTLSQQDKITLNKIVNNYQKYYTNYRSDKYRQDLEQWYKHVTRQNANLDNPRTYNEKMQWLKLYNSTPIKTKLADKYLVRDWVKETIGEEYLIPLLGVYDKFDDIDFAKLPNQFVIKCNHGCAYNIIVKDKSQLDLADVKAKLNKWMTENFAFKYGVELHYRDIQPKIIIEKFIENKSSGDLYDYKFWCFNGKVHYIQFLSERNLDGLKMAFYDINWKKQSFVYSYPLDSKNIDRPSNIDLMINLAEKLSRDFNHVRVDFYRLDDGTIYFGEITFTSASGVCKWNDEKINKHLGDLIKLPKLAYNIDTGEYYKLPKPNILKKTWRTLEPYVMLPYYQAKLPALRNKVMEANVKLVEKQLSNMRIDIKNFGSAQNAMQITSPTAKFFAPAWFTNDKGIGQVVTDNHKQSSLQIKCIKDGKLFLSFKGIDARKDGKRFPVYIDYQSIKINNKEILSSPISVWHDAPYNYEMIVKDGQIVNVEINQRLHTYPKDELRDIVLKLNPNNDYIKNNIDKICPSLFVQPKEQKQPQDTTKSLTLDKVSRFFYHRENKNFCTKTYICGIRIRKKINELEFMESRFANLSAQLNNKVEQTAKSQNDTFNRNIKNIQTKVEQIAKTQDVALKENIKNLHTKIEQLAKTQKETSAYNFTQICEYLNQVKDCSEVGIQQICNYVNEVKSSSDASTKQIYQQIEDVEKTFDITSKQNKQMIENCLQMLNKQTEQLIKQSEISLNNKEQLLDGIKSITTKAEENKNQLSASLSTNNEQINNLQKVLKENKEQADKNTSSIISTIERDQVLYNSPFEVRTRTERGLCDIVSAPNFEERFRKLISNLPQRDVATIVDIVKRLQTIKGTNHKIDLYNTSEKSQMKELKSYYQSILKISDNLYCYQNYFLPINHFEASVFFYKHGIDRLSNLQKLKDKAILDVGAFIGDSALILSPLTNDKVYSFEATTENYNHMLKTIELNNLTNIVPIKTAVGAEQGTIELRCDSSCSSSSDIMVKNPKSIENCPVIRIDDYVKEHNLKVGLIKVDIEGAEQEFLKGAIQTIKEQKPTLLISIYHNVDDFLDIKPMIENWKLGYKFSIFKPVVGTVSGETLLICE